MDSEDRMYDQGSGFFSRRHRRALILERSGGQLPFIIDAVDPKPTEFKPRESYPDEQGEEIQDAFGWDFFLAMLKFIFWAFLSPFLWLRDMWAKAFVLY